MTTIRFGRRPRRRIEIWTAHALDDRLCIRENRILKGSAVPSRVTIAGHVVIDQVLDQKKQVLPRYSLGGPVSYSSLALASLGYRCHAVTKIGDDFPRAYSLLLRKRGRLDVEAHVLKGKKTTSFRIERYVQPRRLWLLDKCEDLFLRDFSMNGSRREGSLLANTVAGEISLQILPELVRKYSMVFLDSQGFVRRFSKSGAVSMRNGLELELLQGVEFLKGDAEELLAWSGARDLDVAIKKLSRFVRYIILTGGASNVRIFDGQKLAWKVRPPAVLVKDTTGAGDIFLAVFAGIFTETENVKASLAKASCAASMALNTKGIEKAILRPRLLSKMILEAEVFTY